MKHCLTTVFCLAGLLTAANAQAERLVLVGASYGKNVLAICDADGEVIWSHKTAGPSKGHAGHHDVQLLANGNILFHDSWTQLTEMTLDKKVVWTYDSATMNGNAGKRVDVHAFARLPNGNTLITESGVGRMIEVDGAGKIVHQIPLKPGGTQSTRLVRMTPQGTYLVCSEDPGVVTEYNRDGEIVWEYPVKTRVYGAIRLRNGNTLIASGGGNSVLEVTPDNQVVWEIKNKVPGTDVELKWTTCLEELDNGNFVVGNCHAGPDNPQIFEIDRNKNIVWEFDEYDLVGNGLACWQILNDEQSALVRKKLAEIETK
ncbi:Arylsulfotransferase (ASST) [Symmachiella macrocystis]|uniref:Arylsulfotransferase (ASST) n=1 Tax=Symmachiella macrocystis TaxID=2527985 RepID=A0A5C6BSL3_9PLAN|nr:PQQ-binding-like beta-propeller repeat protein [Symmachiella macrocystis]TWU13704.1 Arylsulfotransferase (ASST) [Symmachiella macrocystis]